MDWTYLSSTKIAYLNSVITLYFGKDNQQRLRQVAGTGTRVAQGVGAAASQVISDLYLTSQWTFIFLSSNLDSSVNWARISFSWKFNQSCK